MKLFKTTLAISAMLGLASCGTVAGIGEDISSASYTVQGWL